MNLERLSRWMCRLLFFASLVILVTSVSDWFLSQFGYTVLGNLGYTSGRLLEFAAIFLIFVVATLLREIRDELKSTREDLPQPIITLYDTYGVVRTGNVLLFAMHDRTVTFDSLAPTVTLTQATGIHVPTGTAISGYEIHLGTTDGPDCSRPFAMIGDRPDGARSASGQVTGTYLHGCFQRPLPTTNYFSCWTNSIHFSSGSDSYAAA